MIYAFILPLKERAQHPASYVWAAHCNFLVNNTLWEVNKKEWLYGGEIWQNNVSQMIKVNIKNGKSCW